MPREPGQPEAGRFRPGTHPCRAAWPVSIPVSRDDPGRVP
jgi:hypothetical protein